MSFIVLIKKLIIKFKVEIKYEFRISGKKKIVIVEVNKNIFLGEFIFGIYYLLVKKIIENGIFNGYLNFDFRESYFEIVDVVEDYD